MGFSYVEGSLDEKCLKYMFRLMAQIGFILNKFRQVHFHSCSNLQYCIPELPHSNYSLDVNGAFPNLKHCVLELPYSHRSLDIGDHSNKW